MLGDMAIAEHRNRLMEIIGAALFFAGILVFLCALASSIWFVLSHKPPRGGF